MPRSRSLWGFALSLTLFAGCDDRSSPSSDSGTSPPDAGREATPAVAESGPPVDARHEAKPPPRDARAEAKPTVVDGPSLTGPCPAALPQAGGACTKEGLVCEYGSNPRCLSAARCQAGTWTVTAVKCLPRDPGCPATRAAAAGQGCSPDHAYCLYSGLVCECTNCVAYPVSSCSGPLKWKCDAPNSDPSCPAAIPNLGSGCAPEGKVCTYQCGKNGARACIGGGWVSASGWPCPISTRRAKRDITYLDEAALARLAEEAAHLRLATYRYRDPALGGRTHLGFILEDHPRCIASDLERQQVDLYSFASMTLALAQQQQKQIDALRAEVASLKARISPEARPRPR